MKYLSLCSGVEAATLAWEPLGWEPVAFSEIDKFPSAVLAHRYQNVPNLGDMTKIHYDCNTKELANGTVRLDCGNGIDLVVGGTPCQGFSVAGEKHGLSDSRSVLALEYIRILDEIRPRWFVWENVPGVFSTNGGGDFKEFLSAIDEIGYHVAWRVLDAQYVRTDGFPRAVPQRRRRVFVIGHSSEWQYPAEVLFEQDCLRGGSSESEEERKAVAKTIRSHDNEYDWVGNKRTVGTLTCSSLKNFPNREGVDCGLFVYDNHAQGSRITECTEAFPTITRKAGTGGGNLPLIMMENGNQRQVFEGFSTTSRAKQNPIMLKDYVVRRLTPLECERLMGFPDNWTRIPWRGKPEEQCPDSRRYAACGNSMCVNVMRWLGKRIAMVDSRQTFALQQH